MGAESNQTLSLAQTRGPFFRVWGFGFILSNYLVTELFCLLTVVSVYATRAITKTAIVIAMMGIVIVVPTIMMIEV